LDGSEEMLTVRIWRGGPAGGQFQSFEVPDLGSQTVLDIVSWVQHYKDASLTYRFACRVGMCGSCAMMVNGVPRWTCRTHISKVKTGGAITIAPLRNLPVIKDLAVDLDLFFEKWIIAGGAHAASSSRHDPMVPVDAASDERAQADAGIECINCAICYAACDTVSGNEAYLGPAALQRAWTGYNDEKHGNRDGILDAVSGAGGCHSCHSMGSCTAYCPNDLDPMRAIAGLKRETMRRHLPWGKR